MAGILLVFRRMDSRGEKVMGTAFGIVPESDGLHSAETSFRAGRFVEASARFLALADQAPDDARVLVRMGQLRLLENRVDEAIEWLGRCAAAGPATPMLAEACYRAGRFPDAAGHYAQCGSGSLARHLESFGNAEPYRLSEGPAATRIAFLAHDPLPLVPVRINGLEDALFLLDTGAWDTVLDHRLARHARVPRGWTDEASFAGGRAACIEYCRLDGLQIGGVEIADLPVQVMALDAALAGFFDPHGVDGVLGLGVLRHFAVEVDMAAGELRLSRRAGAASAETPCWFGTGRQLLAWGDIHHQPNLWFIDTGMMGFDCLLPQSTAAAVGLGTAGVPVQGYGGGGGLALSATQVPALGLGGFCKPQARGVISEGFGLEHCYGFRIGGLLSAEFLRHTVLCLDFPRMRLGVQAAPAA